jgi:phospholipid/cholesterol/gamma-HCH transport system permease protein
VTAVSRLGVWFIAKVRNFLYAMGFMTQIFAATIRFFRRNQTGFRVLVQQILFTGFEALRISAILAITIGAAIIAIGSSLLPQFGQSQLMYSILIIIITKELGPLLTAFIIIARSGTAIATELAGMVVRHEIEAFVSVGVNPVSYIVVPRVVGVTASLVVLTLYFNAFGLLGSFVFVQLIKSIPFPEYMGSLLATLKPLDILAGVAKSFIFGLIISIVACYQGFRVERASTEIPQAGIRAVGQCFMLCVVADLLITLITYS